MPSSAPRAGFDAVGAVLERAGHEQHAAAHRRQRDEDAARHLLAEQREREERHDHDLEVAEHGRQAGADVLIA